MTEINIKIKLTDDVKAMLDKFCYELEETAEEFIESRVDSLIGDIVKAVLFENALLEKDEAVENFDNQVKSGNVFSVTVENAGGNNENG